MGTSISHPSPRNINWKPVHIGYVNKLIPENRIINEIWRAAENSAQNISSEIRSDSIFRCFEIINNSKNFQEAVTKYEDFIKQSRSNSIVVELAKRVIPNAFESKDRTQKWSECFFSEVTRYIVSRDASGFVGGNNRNATVAELIQFKKSISSKVESAIGQMNVNISTKKDWDSFVTNSINHLKSIV